MIKDKINIYQSQRGLGGTDTGMDEAFLMFSLELLFFLLGRMC
jgi:hypothetical protein